VVDFTPYTQGYWQDPTLDLRDGACLTNTDPGAADWTGADFDDAAWKPCMLDVLNFAGAPAGQPAWLRRDFVVPDEWFRQGGDIYLISGNWSGPHYLGKARMYLNGQLLQDWTTGGYNEYVITQAVNKGRNVVAFQFQGGPQYVGIQGNVFLYHRAPALRALDLAARWEGRDAQGRPAGIVLPGKGAVNAPTRAVLIPQEWRGKYRVRLCLEGQRESILGAWVNGQLVRRHHHGLGSRCDIDITAALKFGEENTLTLARQDEANAPRPPTGTPPQWQIDGLRLELFAE
jgi:hypothetical protein